MKRFASIILLIFSALTVASMISVFAQAAMSSWAFVVEVTPGSAAPGTYNLVVPLQVMDKARDDLADLRLYDTKGKEIPYALRIRRDVDETREVEGRLFKRRPA
jgi:hypothetical protein